MRIHTENTEQFIQSLATSIVKDPASLENWRCLHVGHNEDSIAQGREEIIRQLKREHIDADCDVVHCADNDVLFISRSLNDEQLDSIANQFIKAAFTKEGCMVECALYDLQHDSRYLKEVLMAKAGNSAGAPQPAHTHSFGEIASLEEVFAEAKKLRKARAPLHVMIVEDDPLTRRLVTGAFKENYALISATNAQEAVANYLLHAPDIVFLDIGLPDVSGLDVLRQIMACDPDAYVVMFSANSYLDNVTAALSAGASGFVSKPFKKDKMRHYIQESAAHHHKQNA